MEKHGGTDGGYWRVKLLVVHPLVLGVSWQWWGEASCLRLPPELKWWLPCPFLGCLQFFSTYLSEKGNLGPQWGLGCPLSSQMVVALLPSTLTPRQSPSMIFLNSKSYHIAGLCHVPSPGIVSEITDCLPVVSSCVCVCVCVVHMHKTQTTSPVVNWFTRGSSLTVTSIPQIVFRITGCWNQSSSCPECLGNLSEPQFEVETWGSFVQSHSRNCGQSWSGRPVLWLPARFPQVLLSLLWLQEECSGASANARC